MFCFFCSIIVVTTQFMSPALHKNFSEADFDFKVCVCVLACRMDVYVPPVKFKIIYIQNTKILKLSE